MAVVKSMDAKRQENKDKKMLEACWTIAGESRDMTQFFFKIQEDLDMSKADFEDLLERLGMKLENFRELVKRTKEVEGKKRSIEIITPTGGKAARR